MEPAADSVGVRACGRGRQQTKVAVFLQAAARYDYHRRRHTDENQRPRDVRLRRPKADGDGDDHESA